MKLKFLMSLLLCSSFSALGYSEEEVLQDYESAQQEIYSDEEENFQQDEITEQIVYSKEFSVDFYEETACLRKTPYWCLSQFIEKRMEGSIEWLNWSVREDNLNLGAIQSVSDNDTDVAISSLRPNFKVQNGVRFNLIYELVDCCYEVKFSYTYMPTTSRYKHFISDNITTLAYAFNEQSFSYLSSAIADFDRGGGGVPDTSNTASYVIYTDLYKSGTQSISSKWQNNLNNFDIDFGKNIIINSCVKIRPHVGLRFTWLDQKIFSNQNLTAITLDATTTCNINQSIQMKELFSGVGLEGGLSTEWDLTRGFSFLGSVGGAILYSKSNLSANTHISKKLTTAGVSTTTLHTIRAKEVIRTAAPMFNYFFGLKYTDYSYCNGYSLALGFEQDVLIDPSRGLLSGQGLTLSLNFDF